MNVEIVTLEGASVRLIPMEMSHTEPLCEVGLDDAEVWQWSTKPIHTLDEMQQYIESALQDRARQVALPFVTIEKKTGRVIGTTRYGNIDCTNHHVEIGWTWIGREWQRTAVNTEAKYLMLRHAFETLGCIRVELKTDVLNERSRNAILRLGAKQEGIFRNHVIVAETGRIRDSVWFSIIDAEWPAVKTNLEAKMASYSPQL